MNRRGRVSRINLHLPAAPSGPPIESSTTFKYNGLEYELNVSTLTRLSLLGQGAHGTVMKMQHTQSAAVMAVKMIPFTSDAAEERKLLRELKLSIAAANCPYIVQFFGAFYCDGNVWICMDVMDISLEQFYRKVHTLHGRFDEDVLSVIAFSVLSALDYLKRELDVIHRDIKPSNVLLSRSGHVKMCDFGISGYLVNSLAKTMVGSQNYMAPEKVTPSPDNQGFGITSDVWSFGITMIEVATGRFPYSEWKCLFDQIRQVVDKEPPRLPSGAFSQEFEDFVGCCLQKKPEDRLKYEALLRHAFVGHLTTKPVDISTFVCNIVDTPSPTA